MPKLELTVVLAFLVGCGASHVATEAFTVSPARADDGPRWDYACPELSKYDAKKIERALQKHGRQGWELVETLEVENERFACFKRPL